MQILMYVLLGVLLVCALAIVVSVVLQKSNEGLSGTISGGSETYYGKDKSAKRGKLLFRISLIACIVFAVAVLAVYVIQPDYNLGFQVDMWGELSEFSKVIE
jgi:preprotein translocase subunit SecG